MAQFLGKSTAKADEPAPPPPVPDEAGTRTAPQGWDALLAEFRVLGGTAENIELRQGPRGRGVFPIDRARPVRLRVPPNLLVPSGDTELRDGRLVVKASTTVGKRERAFFDRYQEDLSWSAGVFDDLWQAQLAWSRLPQVVQDALRAFWRFDGSKFSEPSEDLCHKQYLETRQIFYRETSVVMPMVEFVNHSGKVARYDTRDGVAVGGTFDEEVLVDYSSDDCWGQAMTYGFCDEQHFAPSLKCGFTFEDRRIEIARAFDRVERFNGFAVPLVRVENDTIRFPFLTLGNTRFPRVPRAVFLHVTKKTPLKRPDELFDIIQHYNSMQLLKFLRVSDGAATPLAAVLRGAAYQQLETLSNHWGTRSLAGSPANP
jgi:hypothetical protein